MTAVPNFWVVEVGTQRSDIIGISMRQSSSLFEQSISIVRHPSSNQLLEIATAKITHAISMLHAIAVYLVYIYIIYTSLQRDYCMKVQSG